MPGTRLGPDPLRGAAARAAAVPILMYHLVNEAPPGTAYPELWVPPARFREEMRLLAAAGYRGITLDRVLSAWTRGTPLPHKPIVVSFDDGYLSQVNTAMPTLRAQGWAGVLNLEVKNIGPKQVPLAGYRRLLRAGWEIDSHTITHPDLTTLDPAALRHEVVDSGRRLRALLHVPVDLFCYPAGRYDAATEAAVRAAGYRAATTTDPGIARPTDDRMALPRVRVDASLAPAALLARLRALG